MTRFTQKEVVGITGITPTTLQNWSNRNILVPEKSPGGGRRLYSVKDIILIELIKELSCIEIDPSITVQVFDQFIDFRMSEIHDHGIEEFINDKYRLCVVIYGGEYNTGELQPSMCYFNLETKVFVFAYESDPEEEEKPFDMEGRKVAAIVQFDEIIIQTRNKILSCEKSNLGSEMLLK